MAAVLELSSLAAMNDDETHPHARWYLRSRCRVCLANCQSQNALLRKVTVLTFPVRMHCFQPTRSERSLDRLIADDVSCLELNVGSVQAITKLQEAIIGLDCASD